MRVISLNLNGIRSAWKKGAGTWLDKQNADFVCVQELKAQVADLSQDMLAVGGLQGYFYPAEKKGYSGVGLYSRQKPDEVIHGMNDPTFDAEGRLIEIRQGNLSVISVYVPSGASSEERQSQKFVFLARFWEYLQQLKDYGRAIIIAGDYNIAHQAIDLKNWRSNQKNSGFLPEEREWIGKVFAEQCWVDVYRRLYPETTEAAYTWWSNRGQAWANNVGWRIDYQLATPDLAVRAREAVVYKAERFSDHAPLVVDYE